MDKSMTVAITEGPEILIKVAGRLDTNSSADFEKAIEPLLTRTSIHVKVDCTGLQYVSSSGLRLFLMLHKALGRQQGTLCLSNLTADVREIFDVTGFSALFKIV